MIELNTWKHNIVCKLFVFDKNTWNHETVHKQVIIIR